MCVEHTVQFELFPTLLCTYALMTAGNVQLIRMYDDQMVKIPPFLYNLLTL